MFSFLLGKMWQWNWQVLCKAHVSLNINVPNCFQCPCAMLILMLSYSVMSDSATAWIVVHQTPLSLEFSRQEYWSGLPCPPSGGLPDPGIKPVSLVSPALAFFTSQPSRKPPYYT